jgi:hypothetical protein
MLALVAALPQASWAVRVIEQLERSYELALSDVDLPGSTSGAVVFKTCATCSTQSLAVTASSRYYIDKQQVTLAELKTQASVIGQSAARDQPTLVMVHYDVHTNIVTRIRISTRNIR